MGTIPTSLVEYIAQGVIQLINTLCPKNIPDIFDCNLKTNDQISIIFGKNISNTTCHQVTV